MHNHSHTLQQEESTREQNPPFFVYLNGLCLRTVPRCVLKRPITRHLQLNIGTAALSFDGFARLGGMELEWEGSADASLPS